MSTSIVLQMEKLMKPRSPPNCRSTRARCTGAAALAWYAALTYRWRGARIAARAPAEWGDPHGPLVLGVAVVSFLATAWCAEVRAWLARA